MNEINKNLGDYAKSLGAGQVTLGDSATGLGERNPNGAVVGVSAQEVQGLWTPPRPVAYNPFPLVDPGLVPFGSRVLVQFRTPPTVTAGGVHLADDAIDAEKWNTQVGIVLAVGPLAFKDRKTQDPWPEGVWAKVGDLVRCPKYGGDRWEMEEPGLPRAFFALFNDLDLLGRVTVGPERMRAFV